MPDLATDASSSAFRSLLPFFRQDLQDFSCFILLIPSKMRASILQRDVRILDVPIDFLTEIGSCFQRGAIPKLRSRLPRAYGGPGNWCGIKD